MLGHFQPCQGVLLTSPGIMCQSCLPNGFMSRMNAFSEPPDRIFYQELLFGYLGFTTTATCFSNSNGKKNPASMQSVKVSCFNPTKNSWKDSASTTKPSRMSFSTGRAARYPRGESGSAGEEYQTRSRDTETLAWRMARISRYSPPP